jgi:tetratricopeptide (TPR) repeat protein
MNRNTLLVPLALTAQLCTYSVANAQLMEDIDFRREGENAVVQIRFVAPVQYQRAVVTKSADLVQVFYNILPSPEAVPTLIGERRASSDKDLPQFVITDEAISRDNLNKRKLLIRFNEPTHFKIRAGKSKESLEIVLEGYGALVGTTPAAPMTLQVERKFAIILQSSSSPAETLKASVPSQWQEKQIFTARRMSEGAALYDISLGYFATLVEAEKAQKLLLKRFPNASVIPFRESAESAQSEHAVAERKGGTESANPEVTLSTPEIEATAKKLLASATAAIDRGDYPDAITALNSVLNLPPNTTTRTAQEQVGLTHLKSGDNRRARAEFETFLKLYPTGSDSDQVRQYLANLPEATTATLEPKAIESLATTSGSVSVFYYGGQSQTRSQEFADSPISGLPVLQSESSLSGADQKQLQTNVDLNWRYRDKEKDMRFVFRDTYSADLMPNRPSKNRLSALYFDQRSFTNGTSFRVGRQSPTGGGVLYRFDGAQVGYAFAPKWKVNAAYGIPTDSLLDTHRSFLGAWFDGDALTQHMSGSTYINQQTIDGEVDRSALGAELRYFNDGVALSGQLDYDRLLQGLNIATVQGSWQFPSTTVVNFLFDRRATPIRALGNALFFQDPTLPSPARNIQDLLATTPIDLLRGQVNGITSYQSQGMLGFTTPITANWQAGANINYTNVDEIKPVAVILPNGQPSTGDLWSVGLQLIGSNLYSTRDTHVISTNFLTGPTYNGTLLSYNNLTGVTEDWQVEPSLRYYTQTDNLGNKTNRWTPGMRMTYRVVKRFSLETELSIEIADSTGPTRNENSQRAFYYIGGRFDF